ncbi:hypothetical protein [Pseudoprimorskyibacter insulae]|uniref:Uncharacterized protein n=1 Tax=Pseudoprimorskyibacter insulae TaxID=1695997 RepID=A0A2R8APY7_9RHOB|nr:hypothetical protein [Pseudoprimorskyibacter insulae]SPF78148.1 hypothetical protein PRI8871_00741 [Pseudoprimorskyibacter insulae]
MIRKLKGDITPERWVGEASKDFPCGHNPWSEIYTDDAALKIAGTLRLENPADITALRLQLAATAEYLLSVFNFAGGASTPAQKYAWAAKIDTTSRRLLAELAESDDLLSSVVVRFGRDNSPRFVPASEMRQRVHEARNAVSALQELVQAVSATPKEDGVATAYAETIQMTVDGMTEVFIAFRGIENVKRSASSGHIDGEFPEFIRASAHPLLAAYFSKFSKDAKRFENLNRQIQTAVAAYRLYD